MFGFSPRVAEIDVKEAHRRLGRAGHVLLDVRSRDEVRAQGIPGALNIPLDELRQAVGTLAGYETIDVICRSGGRSAMATQLLHAQGVTQARSVSGGIIAWAAAGLPTAG